MSLFQARPNFLPAALTGLREPLGTIGIGEQQSNRFLAKDALAWFHRNWQIELFFLDSPYYSHELGRGKSLRVLR
jgi:hypothetical protein